MLRIKETNKLLTLRINDTIMNVTFNSSIIGRTRESSDENVAVLAKICK